MTPFDEMVLPKELQMMKAFLPFLPAEMQKMMAILIRWQELKYTIAYYQNNRPSQMAPEIGNFMKCLQGILPPEEQAQISQFADIFENIDMYRDMFEGFSSAFGSDNKEGNP